jgi:hypothetical protein
MTKPVSFRERFDEMWNEHDGTHHYRDEWRDFFLQESVNIKIWRT